MPFTRIALPGGKNAAFRQTLSTLLHQTLVDFFDVPQDDCFQLFDEYAPGLRVFPRHYPGGPRSEGFLWSLTTAGRPRSVVQTPRFYRPPSHRLSSQLQGRPEDVTVTSTSSPPDAWSFATGHGLAAT